MTILLRLFVVACSLCMTAVPGLAQVEAEPSHELEPASPWNADYAENSCAIMRAFGEEDERVLLEFRQFMPGSQVRAMVASSRFEATRSTPLIRLGNEQEQILEDAEFIDASEMGGFFSPMTLTPVRSGDDGKRDYSDETRNARELAMNTMVVGGAFEQNLQLQTGSLHAPMNALRACLDDLLVSWGVDLEAMGNVSEPTRPINQSRWVRQIVNHYPRDGLRFRRAPTISVRLLIGPDGRVMRCASLDALTNEDFEAVACAAFHEYATFEPALDADGNPTYDFWSTKVIYQIN